MLCAADAPSFQTQLVSGELQVVEFPEENPYIDDIKQYYRIGELLETNCSSNSSIPPAKLEWWINDLPIYSENLIKYKTISDPGSNRETSVLGLQLLLTPEHFFRGRIKVINILFFIVKFAVMVGHLYKKRTYLFC